MIELTAYYVPKIYQQIGDNDLLIEHAAGQRSIASGYGGGQRDICFEFADPRTAYEAKKKIEGITGLFELSVAIEEKST